MLQEANAEEIVIHAAEMKAERFDSEKTKMVVNQYLASSKAAEANLEANDFEQSQEQDIGESSSKEDVYDGMERQAVRHMKRAAAQRSKGKNGIEKMKRAIAVGQAAVKKLSSEGMYIRAAQTLAEVLKVKSLLSHKAVPAVPVAVALDPAPVVAGKIAAIGPKIAKAAASQTKQVELLAPHQPTIMPGEFFKSMQVAQEASKTTGEQTAKVNFLKKEAKNEEKFMA